MPAFTYKALGANGAVENGQIDAGDRGEALRVLDRKGLQPVSLKQLSGDDREKAQKARKTGSQPRRPSAKSRAADAKSQPARRAESEDDLKLKRADIVLFTEELSDMLAAGLQLEPALKAMENRQELGALKDVAQAVRHLVRDGTSFSRALNMVSPSFGPLYCSLAAAGEASGALDQILKRQAHYLKTLSELQGRLVLALIYPAFLVVAGIGVAIVFSTVLIPQLTSLIESSPGGKLPGPIRALVVITDHFGAYWYIYLIVIVVAGLLFKVWKDNEDNRPTWDRVKLDMPLVGPVISSRFYVQFLETMANLVGNGLNLLRSLELTRDATQNLSLRSALNDVIDQVGDGRSLSRAMIRTERFPSLLIDMVSVGEQTGKIDISLRRAAERYDRELQKSLDRIMALIMPTILIIMALMIGTMAYLMINAIFQTISNVGGR
jgi:type II secretory pathway component PulF